MIELCADPCLLSVDAYPVKETYVAKTSTPKRLLENIHALTYPKMLKILYSAVQVHRSVMRLRRWINCVGSMQDTLGTGILQEAMHPVFWKHEFCVHVK